SVGALGPSPLKSWKSMKADVPSFRMKFTLLGSTPSAIQATLTPAPVMPSERAVWAKGSFESVFVTSNASGTSASPLAPQAPGMIFGVSDVLGVNADTAVEAAV